MANNLKFLPINNDTEYEVSGYEGRLDAHVEIPSSYNEKPVTSIGNNALSYSTTLNSVVIPESITHIGKGAFYGCSVLVSAALGKNVTSIYPEVFNNCVELRNVVLPEGITTISSYMFSSCWSLTNITIPNSVTSIGNFAFSNCNSLISIEIPKSVTSIGSYAFEDCSSLTSVIVSAKEPPVCKEALCSGSTHIEVIGCPQKSLEAYKAAVVWNSYADKIVGFSTDLELSFIRNAASQKGLLAAKRLFLYNMTGVEAYYANIKHTIRATTNSNDAGVANCITFIIQE